MQSDQFIIQQALGGDQSAYGELVQRYQGFVYGMVLKMIKKREVAEEVTQDCFLRAFRYLSSYRGEAQFSTWLYRIVYTTSLNHLRKKNPKLLSLDDDEKPIHIDGTDGLNPQKAIEQKEEYASIRTAIQQLSPTDAAIISLFYLQEQKLEEICDTMQLTMSNAKTKLCRARKRLKPILESAYQQNH